MLDLDGSNSPVLPIPHHIANILEILDSIRISKDAEFIGKRYVWVQVLSIGVPSLSPNNISKVLAFSNYSVPYTRASKGLGLNAIPDFITKLSHA